MGDILSNGYKERDFVGSRYDLEKRKIKEIAKQIEEIKPFSEEYEQIVFLIEHMDKVWRNRKLIKLLG